MGPVTASVFAPGFSQNKLNESNEIAYLLRQTYEYIVPLRHFHYLTLRRRILMAL